MRKPRPFPVGTKELLQDLLKEVRTKLEYQRVLCVWLRVLLGLASMQIASAVGCSQRTVKRVQDNYLRYGESALEVKNRGGRYYENMTFEKEKELLSSFFKKAGEGEILVVSEIKAAYEEKIGRKVPKSTVYRMLSRHGWRKVAPRHRHPKSDISKQEELKKTSRI